MPNLKNMIRSTVHALRETNEQNYVAACGVRFRRTCIRYVLTDAVPTCEHCLNGTRHDQGSPWQKDI